MLTNIELVPTKKLFEAKDSLFKIYSCKTKDKSVIVDDTFLNFTIKGEMDELQLDKEYTMDIEGKRDARGRFGYIVNKIHRQLISTPEDQFAFLDMILSKKQAEAFRNTYGDEKNILSLIVNNQVDVDKLHGIGDKSLRKIRSKVSEHMKFQKAFLFFNNYDITDAMIIKLVKEFVSVDELIQTVKKNPYRLTNISGIGFMKADAIALGTGYDPEGRFRILAAIEHSLKEQGNKGHTYMSKDQIVSIVTDLIKINKNLIEEQIVSTEQVILLDDDRIALRDNYMAEDYVANRLVTILRETKGLQYDYITAIEKAEEKNKIKLSTKQKKLFEHASKYPVNILEGYAGTGKSKTVQSFLLSLKMLKKEFLLVSPSAIAAKVLKKYTSEEAYTIHRIIAQCRGDITMDTAEYLIIDEAGMVDIKLLKRLLEVCTHPDLKILFIGDPFQLPSIGEGNLLYDLIHSQVIPKVLLDEVFRQQEGGMLDVITNVRQGKRFLSNSDWGIKEFGNDCIMACVPQNKLFNGIMYYFEDEMNKYSSDDITVTIPTKNNKFGTVAVNASLQEFVNPEDIAKDEVKTTNALYRVGDLVINTTNKYTSPTYNQDDYSTASIENYLADLDIVTSKKPIRYKDIVNGDVGKIVSINQETSTVIVDFDFCKCVYDFGELGNILHFWASTIHKMQGNSNKCVIVVLDGSHKFQLTANLVYTAMTRPEEKLIILCQAETLNYAMNKRAELSRNTFLVEMLKKYDKLIV